MMSPLVTLYSRSQEEIQCAAPYTNLCSELNRPRVGLSKFRCMVVGFIQHSSRGFRLNLIRISLTERRTGKLNKLNWRTGIERLSSVFVIIVPYCTSLATTTADTSSLFLL